ncbi:MAG: PorP/SprF family type IX secretion system membrane protein [Marinilabiliaceae bacterium]|nr:PorP/SprF family type IX secretion system membrane protein [Marinilabiliaceae bacterium]
MQEPHTVKPLSWLFKVFVLCLICNCNMQIKAQDVSFSQMYASPLYLSPSFAGLINGTRLSMSYRDQWPGVPNTYKTYAFALDHFFMEQNSGVGLMFLRDDSGNGQLVRQDISVLYSYEIEVTRDIFVRPGIQFKYAERNLNLLDAILPSDQGSDGSLNPGSGSGSDNDNHKQIDAAASAMIYSDYFWAGIAVDHLIRSDIGVTDIETYQPIKTSIYGGYKHTYREGRKKRDEQSLTLAFNYRMQQGFNQLDIGTYWYINPLELGLWYRGIPFASESGLMNNDGLIFILGFNVGPVRCAYSYDLTLSDLGGMSNGANEMTLIYRFNQTYKKKRSRGAIPCWEPGNSSGSGSKYRRRSRKIF